MRRLRRLAAGTWRVLRATGRALAAVPHPGINDLIEITGVVLVAVALAHVHIALALGVPGVYMVVVADVRAGMPGAPRRR